MSKAQVKVKRVRTKRTVKVKKSNRGNPNKCPVCGKFMGSGKNG